VNIYLVNGTEDYCRGNWVQNAYGTVLCGSLRDVHGVNVRLNRVLLSHNRQVLVSWRIEEEEEEEGVCFIPTAVQKNIK
jgi:hypothetical protein